MDATDEQITLRDQLAANLDAVSEEVTTDADTTQDANADVDAAGDDSQASVAEQPKSGRTAGRPRDEKGRLLPGKAAEKPENQEQAQGITQEATTQPPVTQEKPKPQRPSTWKKDYWEAYDKLAAENPALAEYINQRESEYARGVSTYKNEAERAKEIWTALEPFMPDLQRHNIQPGQWIGNLGRAHQTLAMGSPQQKIQMFQRLAQDYGVPIQALAPQPQYGADGQPVQQQNPLEPILPLINPLYEQVRQLQGQLHSYQSAQEQAQQQQLQAEISKFSADKPHFEQVRDTMARLLESGMAQDLDEAYQVAVRHPQHDDIFQSLQQQQREAEEKRRAEEQRANVARARNNTVSTRSGAPTAPKAKGGGNTGLREALEEAFESQTSGRV